MKPNLRVLWNVPVPMRDGTTLSVTIQLPESDSPVPAVLSMTPYGNDTFFPRGRGFTKNGYAAVCADVRGRGSSPGTFEPFMNDARDGHDLVVWTANQPWCDGRVVMCGGSYAGMAQWYTASQQPRPLRAIIPTAPSLVGFDIPTWNGIFPSYWIRWITLTSGKQRLQEGFSDTAFWFSVFERLYREHLPFADLDRVAGNPDTHFRTWVAHHEPDAYWTPATLDEGAFAAVNVPVLSITGLFDGALQATLVHVERHSSAHPQGEHTLIIGPWDHLGTRKPQRVVGGLTLGQNAMLNIDDLHNAWFDWHLARGEKPSILQDRFVYYVVGLDEWRCAADVASATKHTHKYVISAREGLGRDVFSAGALSLDPANESEPLTFEYDPLDVRPADVLTDANILDVDLYDQTADLHLFGNGAVYHSEPFTNECVLAGAPLVKLYASVNVPDTDLEVRLSLIYPNGKVLKLGSDMLRLRYRNSLEHPSPVEAGERNRYVFSRMPFLSHLAPKQSRLRLTIACVNTPHMQKNYNSGGDVRYETAADARTARVTIHQRPPHHSSITIGFDDLSSEMRIPDAVVMPWLSS